MKKFLFLFMVAAVLSLCASCAEGMPGQDESGLPVGTLFYTGSPVAFYFVDENGADLIDLTDSQSVPISFPNQVPDFSRRDPLSDLHSVESPVQTWLLNGNSNSISFDRETGLKRFNTYLWGVTPREEYRIYLYRGEEEYPIDITYKYTTSQQHPEIVGSSWAVDVTSMKMLGIEVFKGNEKGKVFIVKPSQGMPTIRVGSL